MALALFSAPIIPAVATCRPASLAELIRLLLHSATGSTRSIAQLGHVIERGLDTDWDALTEFSGIKVEIFNTAATIYGGPCVKARYDLQLAPLCTA